MMSSCVQGYFVTGIDPSILQFEMVGNRTYLDYSNSGNGIFKTIVDYSGIDSEIAVSPVKSANHSSKYMTFAIYTTMIQSNFGIAGSGIHSPSRNNGLFKKM